MTTLQGGATLALMEYRRLGSSGMYVSEITYGNWITHGSQVEQDAAFKCVRAAFDSGITTFDTADVYAGTRAETVLGKALKGVKRESYELLTKVYFPTGPGKNDRGLSRKHIMESVHASLKRLQTDHIDLYQFHRFDYETPLEESLSAVDDLIRQGTATGGNAATPDHCAAYSACTVRHQFRGCDAGGGGAGRRGGLAGARRPASLRAHRAPAGRGAPERRYYQQHPRERAHGRACAAGYPCAG